ncbi:MAG: hypothetical protein HN337_01205 [Deltaproteobacteria bacterium]|jgi:hypothetical protein|nr:hypothetical protein [Deltaproteobacteria bacterium]
MAYDKVDDAEGNLHDGSWAKVKKKRILDLLNLDTDQYENPQVYWLVIERRLDRLKLKASEKSKMRQVFLDMMFEE